MSSIQVVPYQAGPSPQDGAHTGDYVAFEEGPILRILVASLDAAAASIFAGLAAWLTVVGRRSRGRSFSSVSLGGGALCAVFAISSVQSLFLHIALSEEPKADLVGVLLGPLDVIRATLTLAVAISAVVLARRFWEGLGRSEGILELVAGRVSHDDRAKLRNLSVREQEVVKLIGEGTLSDEALAAAMHVARSTAAKHVQNILQKTGVRSRRELLILAAAPAPRFRQSEDVGTMRGSQGRVGAPSD
jgi:DNA-binding CsgD family transcriptional regulator